MALIGQYAIVTYPGYVEAAEVHKASDCSIKEAFYARSNGPLFSETLFMLDSRTMVYNNSTLIVGE